MEVFRLVVSNPFNACARFPVSFVCTVYSKVKISLGIASVRPSSNKLELFFSSLMVLLQLQCRKNRWYLCACVSWFQIFSDNQPENPSIPDKALVGLLILQHLLTQAHGPISRTLIKSLFNSWRNRPSPESTKISRTGRMQGTYILSVWKSLKWLKDRDLEDSDLEEDCDFDLDSDREPRISLYAICHCNGTWWCSQPTGQRVFLRPTSGLYALCK